MKEHSTATHGLCGTFLARYSRVWLQAASTLCVHIVRAGVRRRLTMRADVVVEATLSVQRKA